MPRYNGWKGHEMIRDTQRLDVTEVRLRTAGKRTGDKITRCVAYGSMYTLAQWHV